MPLSSCPVIPLTGTEDQVITAPAVVELRVMAAVWLPEHTVWFGIENVTCGEGLTVMT